MAQNFRLFTRVQRIFLDFWCDKSKRKYTRFSDGLSYIFSLSKLSLCCFYGGQLRMLKGCFKRLSSMFHGCFNGFRGFWNIWLIHEWTQSLLQRWWRPKNKWQLVVIIFLFESFKSFFEEPWSTHGNLFKNSWNTHGTPLNKMWREWGVGGFFVERAGGYN